VKSPKKPLKKYTVAPFGMRIAEEEWKMSKQPTYVPKGLYPFKTKLIISLALIVVISFYLVSSIKTESFIWHFFVKFPNVIGLIGDFFPPDWSYLEQVWPKLFETIHMAIIATTIAVLISIPFSLLTAHNVTTNTWVYQFMRFILNITRTIPDIILSFVFV